MPRVRSGTVVQWWKSWMCHRQVQQQVPPKVRSSFMHLVMRGAYGQEIQGRTTQAASAPGIGNQRGEGTETGDDFGAIHGGPFMDIR